MNLCDIVNFRVTQKDNNVIQNSLGCSLFLYTTTHANRNRETIEGRRFSMVRQNYKLHGWGGLMSNNHTRRNSNLILFIHANTA